jgi:Zn-dependent M28 family amino/carboxypeptidase
LRTATFLVACVVTATPAGAQSQFDGATWWQTVRVLADDRFEGRDTGSPGERAARRYIAARLAAAGVSPAGTRGYEQSLDLKSSTLVEADSSLALVADGRRVPLAYGEYAIVRTGVEPAPVVDAPLVFVGYGLTVPEARYDDYAGLDLRGAVAVVLTGSPASMPIDVAAHAQSPAERWKALRAAGAIGLLVLQNPESMDVPWERAALHRTQPSMSLVGAEFDDSVGARFAALFNPAHGDLLFEGTGHSFAELAALATTRAPLPRFVLPLRLQATHRVRTRIVHSANLVATIRGTDPALRDEYVVLSAHLDHLGVGEPIGGDRIYNGAMDNAAGSALLLDVAESLARGHVRLRRSVMFVWTTGEEKGLLGSRYFVTHPTVPIRRIVADLNTDMFLPIVPLQVLIVLGMAESDLGDRAARVAHALGYRAQAEGDPLLNAFVRSDQYSFIKRGVPSLSLKIGFDPGSPDEAVMRRWLAERYHAPSDDTGQPVDLASAAAFEQVIRDLTVAVANDPKRPTWNDDSFFRRYAPATR